MREPSKMSKMKFGLLCEQAMVQTARLVYQTARLAADTKLVRRVTLLTTVADKIQMLAMMIDVCTDKAS